MNRFVPVLASILALSLAFSLSGCGKSQEELALEHTRSIKKPGWLRVVNMTDASTNVYWKGNPLIVDIPGMGASYFQPVGVGKQPIELKQSGNSVAKLDIEVGSKALYTMVLFEDGTTAMVDSEQMYASDQMNLQSFFVGTDGKPFGGKVVLSGAEGTYEITDKSGGMKIPLGDYSLSGEGLAMAKGSKVEYDSSYTMFVVRTGDGKSHGMLLRNASPLKPVLAGAGE